MATKLAHCCAGRCNRALSDPDAYRRAVVCNRYATYGETNALQGALTSLELDWADETPLRPADIYPDQDAQIVRQIGDALALVEARWGFLKSKKALSYHKHS